MQGKGGASEKKWEITTCPQPMQKYRGWRAGVLSKLKAEKFGISPPLCIRVEPPAVMVPNIEGQRGEWAAMDFDSQG
jgi:hypothetical protein